MSKIQEALRHVHAHFPQVTQVKYDGDFRWLYSDGKGNAPSFEGVDIDTGLLEDATDEVPRAGVYHLQPQETVGS